MGEDSTPVPARIQVRGGTMYFPTSLEVPAGALASAISTAVLEAILGPRPAACVLLVGDHRDAGAVAAGLAARCAALTEHHPNAPWGVLLLTPGLAAFEDCLAQIRSTKGNLVVIYTVTEPGVGMSRAAFIRTVTTSTKNPYVVLTTPQVWQDELDEPYGLVVLGDGGSVIDASEPQPDTIWARLREHATQLAVFHGVKIPDHVIAAAAADGPGDEATRDSSNALMAQPELGCRRLDRWAARAALNGAQIAEPHKTPYSLTDLHAKLAAVVHGQDHAVQTVAEQVTLGQAGLRLRADRPRSVVLLTGSTGTGKSLLGMALADALGGFGRLVRVNLSGMTEAHDIATLLGSPPGYVGSSEPGRWLTTRIAARPDAVLLFDEVDKGHPSMFSSILVELLGAGTLTDAQGRVVDARGLHVVLTANLGAGELLRRSVGFGDNGGNPAAALRAVRTAIPDEVFNRIDAVVVMNPLSPTAVSQILDGALEALGTRLAPLGLSLDVTPAARAALTRAGINPTDGARLLHRTVEQLVLTPLLTQPAGRYVADATDGTVTVTATPC